MADIPTNEPARLVAGNTWQWRREDLAGSYPAPTWSLAYYYILKGATPATFQIDADADGEFFAVNVDPATTAEIAAGDYEWNAYVTDGTDRFAVDRGTLRVEPDFAVSTEDPRTFWETVRDNVRAVIEGRATKDQESYTINGRTLARTPIEDLVALYDRAQQEISNASQAEKIAQGFGDGRTILTRFGRNG